jgi:hypothetical protein
MLIRGIFVSKTALLVFQECFSVYFKFIFKSICIQFLSSSSMFYDYHILFFILFQYIKQ